MQAVLKIILLILKGIPIGMANVLPGLSGGTVALLLDIYEELIDAIKNIRLSVLLPIAIGALFAILSSANIMTFLLAKYQGFMHSFLFFLILASAKITLNEVEIYKIKYIFLGLLSFVIAYIIAIYSHDPSLTTNISFLKIALSGFLGATAMLLPGISGATILVLLGTYEPALNALINFDFVFIITFAISGIFGILGLAWIISYFLQNYKNIMMIVLSGLILGSSFAVIPQKISPPEIAGFLLVAIIFTTGHIWSKKSMNRNT